MKNQIKIIFVVVINCLAFSKGFAQQKIGNNPTTMNSSALLELESTTKGFLPPRMTNAQMTAIATPATGLITYCTDCSPAGLYVYNSTAWVKTANDASKWTNDAANARVGLTHLSDGTTARTAGTEFVVTDAGNVGIGTVTPAAKLDVAGDTRINGLTIGRGAESISSNTAVGVITLTSNTTGSYNTANGFSALSSNTEGSYNTANGAMALTSNTIGSYNTANGLYALFYNTTGSNNTANGAWALTSNTIGGENTANGFNALEKNTIGNSNTAVGVRALPENTTGSNNIAIGVDSGGYTNAGAANATGSNSLFLGYDTRANADGETNQIVIGAEARGNGSNSATYGNNNITKHIFTSGNVGIGTVTPAAKLDVAGDTRINGLTIGRGAGNIDSNTAVGASALASNTIGEENTAVGASALTSNMGWSNTAAGASALQNNITGGSNTAIGKGALQNNISGGSNTAIGITSLYSNTEGYSSTAVGTNALYSNTTGTLNSAMGVSALYNNTIGRYNTAVGGTAMYYNLEGWYNTANGHAALFNNTTGWYNIALGANALYNNTTGSNNIAVGFEAGRYAYSGGENQTGSNSLFLGYDTRANADGETNQIVIGAGARGNGSNSATYGNNAIAKHIFTSGNVGIGTTSPTHKLHIEGGSVRATSFIANSTTYADYVLENYVDGNSKLLPSYKMLSLTETENFIKTNKHLPGVTGINELTVDTYGNKEVDMTKLQQQMLEKIEELYLHTIEQQKQIDELKEALKKK